MNNSEQSTSYEAVPCRMVADAVPLVAQEEDFSNPKEVRIRGLTALTTSPQEAQAHIDGQLREVERRLKLGDHQGLVDILAH